MPCMRRCTLGKGEGRVLLHDVMDNAFCATRVGPFHAMQPLVYKGIYNLHADNRPCQQRCYVLGRHRCIGVQLGRVSASPASHGLREMTRPAKQGAPLVGQD